MSQVRKLNENSNRAKIAIFCIDKTYLSYHNIGLGFELSRIEKVDVIFLCNGPNHKLVTELSKQNNINNIEIIKFKLDTISSLFPSLADLIPRPIYRPFILWLNKRHLFKKDAFVVPLYDYLNLKTKWPTPLYVFSDHGIANRAYSFDKRITQFDLLFLTGKKEKKERSKLGQLTNTNYKMTGFLKYDVVKNIPTNPMFKNQNKIILYNPHWEKELTSFYKFGFLIIAYFTQHPEVNLIIAPHNKLIFRNALLRKKLERYNKYPNIIFDAGSEQSYNMTYTKLADLYIGDVSSQALEFLFIKPRPCLFFDAHELESDSTNRPISWDFGDIINNAHDIGEKINRAFKNYGGKYKNIQEEKRKIIFHIGEESPSRIAAKAIVKQLENKFTE